MSVLLDCEHVVDVTRFRRADLENRPIQVHAACLHCGASATDLVRPGETEEQASERVVALVMDPPVLRIN